MSEKDLKEIEDRVIFLERKAMEAKVAYSNDLISYADFKRTTDELITEQRRLKHMKEN